MNPENKDEVVKEDYLAGRILGSDIIRLVRPFIYLYNDLMKKTKEANERAAVNEKKIELKKKHEKEAEQKQNAKRKNDETCR